MITQIITDDTAADGDDGDDDDEEDGKAQYR